MSAPQAELTRLSRQRYVDFLEEAKARGFSFVRFQDFLAGARSLPQPYIALRHDVDFAPGFSLELAELEHAAGVASTYFVLVDGQFYNALDGEAIRQVRTIHTLGHEIGLHFAVKSAVHPEIGQEIAFRMQLLSTIVGTPVRSFSQHDPVNAGRARVVLPAGQAPCIDADSLVEENDLLYVSESAMMWRTHTFETALEQNRNLCLLAHPHLWLHLEDDYVALVRDLESREVQRVSARFDAFVEALAAYYDRRLREGM